jgi:23S rRNA pseudouridine1911/1915/1917 synthase
LNIQAEHIVEEISQRIRFSDYALGLFEQLPSRKSVKKAIKKGRLLLNEAVVEGGRFLKAGDRILLLAEEQELPILEMKLEVHYEDEHLAIVYKPAGIPVSGYQKRTLEMALPFNLSLSKEKDALAQPRPVHRLDLPTRGLLLIAKTASCRIALGEAFANGTIHKRYQAVAMGRPPEAGQIDSDIAEKEALTSFQLLKTVDSLRSGQLSLLNLYPKTGRKHQLRIHLSEAGYPILGDKQYGKAGETLLHKGLFLAACGLNFQHPITKEEINLQLETPYKFEALLEREQRRYDDYYSR